MREDKRVALSRLEWEGFTKRIKIDKIIKSESIPKGAETIEIWRDDNYKLNGRILGGDDGYSLGNMDKEEGIAGTIVPSIEIQGTDYYGFISYRLSHCYIGDSSIQVTSLDSKSKSKFVANIMLYRVEKKELTDMKSNMLIEWYLNGPSGSFIFSRSTNRQLKEDFIRKRFDNEERLYPGTHRQEDTRDFAFIELENRSFIIQAVPKYFGPEWSNCIGIEYREEWGGIPDEEEREAICEIVGFVLGKHLLNVGYSKFSETGYPLEEVAINPWGDNVISKCQVAALFPIEVNNYQTWGILEKILTKLIPQYLLLRNDLNLKQALWNYWISLDLPIGVNLPILSAGVETIAKSWFKTSKSKTKGVYLAKKKYEELLISEFNSIEEKLKESTYQQRMLNKIKNAYNMGANERLDFFFSEIDLPIGEIERNALSGRNSMAHGDIMSDQEIEKKLQLTRAFQTLFHRILLKILGYDGDYIDRSAEGWPKRNINEPMQGPRKNNT
ncbi:MAG: hypothetical protein KIC94_14925 [Clostridiales bacterium]|nr:hypothetical protein [Clostridiales bacterium]